MLKPCKICNGWGDAEFCMSAEGCMRDLSRLFPRSHPGTQISKVSDVDPLLVRLAEAEKDAERYRLVRLKWFLQENLDWYATSEEFDKWVDGMLLEETAEHKTDV